MKKTNNVNESISDSVARVTALAMKRRSSQKAELSEVQMNLRKKLMN